MSDEEAELDELDEIERRLLDAVEGDASPADLDARLAADPVLRARLVRRLIEEAFACEELQVLDAESRLSGNGLFGPEAVEPLPVAVPAGRSWWVPGGAGAIAFAAASLLFALFLGGSPEREEPPRTAGEFDEVAESEGVAILTQAMGVEWLPGGPTYRVNDRIPVGRLRIASGLLQLEFFGGAAVILEGPADFEILSAMRCRFRRGKLRAEVPPQAIGFTVQGGDFDVVDLGTEFALRMDEHGAGEVHVLDGEVSLRRGTGRGERLLKEGEAVRFAGKGEPVETPVDRTSFVDLHRLRELNETSRVAAYARWRAHRDRWASDPSLAIYFDFERQSAPDRRLKSAIGDGAAPDGAIVGCRWTEGRFEGKGALEFKRTSDRVRVTTTGEFAAMSLVAWLRMEGFDRWYSSLLMADGYEKGKVHWQLTQEGRLKFSVGGERGYATGTILKPDDLGRWVHLATVYDPHAKQVRHFVDGRPVATAEIGVVMPLKFEQAEIGNWNPQRSARQGVRSLNGRLDELAVFRRVLSAEEIHAAYQAGRPNP